MYSSNQPSQDSISQPVKQRGGDEAGPTQLNIVPERPLVGINGSLGRPQSDTKEDTRSQTGASAAAQKSFALVALVSVFTAQGWLRKDATASSCWSALRGNRST